MYFVICVYGKTAVNNAHEYACAYTAEKYMEYDKMSKSRRTRIAKQAMFFMDRINKDSAVMIIKSLVLPLMK